MSVFRIKIANCVIQIETIYPQCVSFCKDFLSNDKPNMLVKTTQQEIDLERAAYELLNGNNASDGNVETQVVFRKISETIVDYGAFLLHGAAIAVDNSAFIFTGHSGVGKTTHILKWLLNGQNVREINGDKPFIVPGVIPMVCGSPWAGKERLYSNEKVPLKAIILLQRSENNKIEKVPLISVYPELCQQIIRTDNLNRTSMTLKMLNSVGSSVQFYRFYINNFKDDCFDVAYNALVGKES